MIFYGFYTDFMRFSMTFYGFCANLYDFIRFYAILYDFIRVGCKYFCRRFPQKVRTKLTEKTPKNLQKMEKLTTLCKNLQTKQTAPGKFAQILDTPHPNLQQTPHKAGKIYGKKFTGIQKSKNIQSA